MKLVHHKRNSKLPNCGQPTLKVKEDDVKNQAIDSKNISSKKAKWQVCVNEN